MADPEHLEILKQGVEVWNKWRNENPTIKPNFNRANLNWKDLRMANFSGADLSNAYLDEVKLGGAQLIEADLSGAYLVEANLSRAQLSGARLIGANLNGANLSGANLSRANLSGADLSAADLKATDLSGVRLSGTLLHGVELNGIDLSRLDLSGADLSGADLIEARLIEADLSRSNLSGANLRRANLSGADLSGADLSAPSYGSTCLIEADFSGARLIEARLKGANLSGARLCGAHLIRADLSEACFNGTDLKGADLSEARLIRAYLSEADLSGANLTEVDLTDAAFEEITLDQVDLSTVKGLETIYHVSPSKIGVETLYRSQGLIPSIFLQNIVLPYELITDLPSLIEAIRPSQFYSCFISYSHKDEDFARRLYSRMNEAKLPVWYAPEEMKGGSKLHEQIFSAIQAHDKLLLVLSENSLQSEWVMTEIRRARKVERENNRRKLFPIRLVSFEMIEEWECFDADSGKDLAVELREYFIPDFSNWKDHNAFESAFERLLRDLKAGEKQA